jgi:hypothetical protein
MMSCWKIGYEKLTLIENHRFQNNNQLPELALEVVGISGLKTMSL